MKNIAIFFGGMSTEHDISIISANLVINAIKNSVNVIPIYITKNNDFYTGDMFDIKVFKNFNEKKFTQVTFVKNKIYIVKGKKIKYYNYIDVAIPVLHGKNGEDGTLQGFFEIMEIPYAQSNVLGSCLTINKLYTKFLLKEAKIPSVEYEYIDKFSNYDIESIVKKIGFPLIIKPVNLGSSIGITKVHNIEELDKAVDLGFMFDDTLIIEKCLENFKEFNISVMNTEKGVETSLIEQPLSKNEILTFKDKYKTKTGKGMESVDRVFPADIPKDLETDIKLYAICAYEIFKLSGVVRIDFLYDENKNIYLNEINSIPGSMAFYLWKDKYTFKQMLENIIKEAELNFKNKKKLTSYFDGTVL